LVYALSLHDALPILGRRSFSEPQLLPRGAKYTDAQNPTMVLRRSLRQRMLRRHAAGHVVLQSPVCSALNRALVEAAVTAPTVARSEEHTSELQSRFD